MRRTSAELKRLSREHLNGHWGFAIGVNLLLGLITSTVLMPFYILLLLSGQGMVQFLTYMVAVVIVGAASIVMQCGIVRIYLGFARRQPVTLGMMFREFSKRSDRYVLAYFLLLAIEFVCILPGIVCWSIGVMAGMVLAAAIGVILYFAGLVIVVMVSLRLALAFILLVDHSDMGIMEAFRESSQLMEGNKGRLFYIYLSFLGLSLLGMLSCGIGMFWIMPYITQVGVNFYRDVTGELDQGHSVDQSQISNENVNGVFQ